jgi:hypothetical protein
MAEQNTITIQFGARGDEDVIKAINKLDISTKKLIDTQAKLVKNGSKTKTDAKVNAVAIDKLRVRLEALGFDYKKVIVSNKNFGSALMGNKVALEKLKISVNNHIRDQEKLANGTEKVSHRTRILGGTFAVLRSKMLLFNFAMGLGIRQLLKFGETSAKVDSMSRAFSTLSGNTERASVSLNKLKDATNNTMTEFDLFQQANNAMILGVADNSDTMSEMFDIAQRLGRALGRDTASSVESLITGIGRQSRLMLDNIGIIVKSEEAYEAYAEKLKTTADKLTDAQKKQAFLEATMESARAKVNSLGVEMLSSQDTLDQLSTATSELATATGDFLQPAISSMSRAFTSVAKSATIYLKTLTNARKVIGEHTSLQEQETIILARIKKEQDSLNYLRKQGALDIVTETKKTEAIMQAQIQLGVVQRKINELIKESNKTKEEEEKKQNKASEADANRLKVLKELSRGIKEAKELSKQQLKEEQDIISSIAEANKTVHKNNLEFQFLEIELQAKRFEQLKLENKQLINQADIVKFVEDAKFEAVSNNLQKTSALYNSFEAGYDTFINSLTDMEMTGAERRKQIFESTKNAFVGFLGEMLKEKIKQIIVEQVISKTAKATSIVEAQATGALIAQAYAVPAFLASTASFGSASIAGLTSLTAGVAGTKALATFEEGGLIGGRRHSQGGTIIEAERGEFIMSRNAVQSIGVETLNQMNQNGVTGSTVNVTIQGGVVDDSYVNNTLIPALNKATSLGNKINA